MHALRRLSGVLALLAGWLLVPAGRADALTAGTGTATVSVNLITSRLTISAAFDSATYDLGVNLGPVGTVSATSVVLSNVNVSTGASFDVPFANASNDFHAVGDIACPSGGCLAPATGPYGFVGFLEDVNVSLLPSTNVYTFDGSATCTGSTVLTCSGPFVLNAFPADAVATGASIQVDRSVSFGTPGGSPRTFDARVILSGVTGAGMLNIAGLSRYRGSIPAGYALTSGAFNALFFDVATDAVFASGRVCVKVDADLNGIVDGTTLTVNQLAILHGAAGGNFSAVPLIFTGPYVCADVLSFSPFVLLVDTSPPPTTTTTSTLVTTTSTIGTTTTTSPVPTTTSTSIPGGTTTSTSLPTPSTTSTTLPPAASTTTTIATPSSTSTTLPPPCATARDCLTAATSKPLCESVDPKLQNTISKKTAVAATKLGKAVDATGGKVARLQKQAKKALSAILRKAAKFSTRKKNPISAACRDSIQRALEAVIGAIDASSI